MDTCEIGENAFADIAEDVTVHIPASYTEEKRVAVEAAFKAAGIPDGVTFDYYTCS